MKLSQIASFAFIVFVTYSCGSATNELEATAKDVDVFTTYQIDINQAKEPIFGFIAQAEVMQLEETEKSLLGVVSRVASDENHYVFRSTESGEFFVYTKEGKFLKNINRSGKGPEEYSGAMDFWLQDGALVIYSRIKQAVMAYDLKGNYLWSKGLSMRANHAMPYAGGLLLDMNRVSFDEGMNYNLVILNDKLEVAEKRLPFNLEERFAMFSEAMALQPYKEHMLYQSQLSDSVYMVKGDEVTPFIHFDFGEDWLWNDRSLLSNGNKAFDAIEKIKKPWSLIARVGPKYLILSYSMGFNPFPHILINRQTGKVVPLKIDQDIAERFNINIIGWEGDRLLCSLPSTEIGLFLDRLNKGIWQLREGSSLEGIEDSENPVFLWLEFK